MIATFRKNINYIVPIALLVLTFVSLAGFNAGVFSTTLDILSTENSFRTEPFNDGSTEYSILKQGGSTTVFCDVKDLAGTRHCGLSIFLSDDVSQGLDLGRFDELALGVTYHSPSDDSKVRLYLKNYNVNYSDSSDLGSLKYNSATFEANYNREPIRVPIEYFQVESWWRDLHGIMYKDSQVDLTNVSIIELTSHEYPLPSVGEYSITLHSMVLVGNVISEILLIKILFVMWLLMSVYLLNRQRLIYIGRNQALKQVSNQDSLTQVLNRRGLSEFFSELKESKAKGGEVTLLYLDLDNFKRINDSYGHLAGDAVLIETCNRVLELVKPYQESGEVESMAVGRISGDEFVILLLNCDAKYVSELAERALMHIAEPIKSGNRLIYDLNGSIGIAKTAFTDKPILFNELLECSDAAMYFAKESGKNQYKWFDNHVQEKIVLKRKISTTLRYALNTHAFMLVYMPIYRLSTLEVVGVEVLLRCTEPSMEGIGPDQFIPVAEEFGMIKEIDLWVIEEAFRTLQTSGICNEKSEFRVSINISAEEMNDSGFPIILGELAAQYQIHPASIELEITETRLIDIDAHNVEILQQIKEQGFRLSLDDFGTGYTAFNQLLNYPVDQLKIDRSFINELQPGSQHDVMVDAILSIASSYQYETVAEGVESQEQLTMLQAKGCDLVQGYFLSKPLKWIQFKELSGVPKGKPRKPVEHGYAELS